MFGNLILTLGQIELERSASWLIKTEWPGFWLEGWLEKLITLECTFAKKWPDSGLENPTMSCIALLQKMHLRRNMRPRPPCSWQTKVDTRVGPTQAHSCKKATYFHHQWWARKLNISAPKNQPAIPEGLMWQSWKSCQAYPAAWAACKTQLFSGGWLTPQLCHILQSSKVQSSWTRWAGWPGWALWAMRGCSCHKLEFWPNREDQRKQNGANAISNINCH